MAELTTPVRAYRFGPFELDVRLGELRRRGLRVRLRGRPLDILRLLIEQRGELVEREVLKARLWSPATFVDFEHGLNSAMNKLREGLGDSADQARFIETVPKRGYRFVGPVDVILAEPPRPSPALERAAPATAPVPRADAPASLVPHSRPAARRPYWYATLAVAALLIAAAVLVGLRTWQLPAGSPARVMLVVLPFENLSGDANQLFFADGVTDELIAQLGALGPSRLAVIARTTSMQYRGSGKDVMTIGRELDVEYVLEGSVQRDGQRARITARLVDVRSQTQLWTESYERSLADVLMLQRDVAGRVARSLAGGVLAPVLARAAPPAPRFAAYELVLRARALRQQATEEGAWQCVAAFEEAIGIDPTYAPAHAGLADCYRLLGAPGWEAGPPVELFAKARTAVERALLLDAGSAEALAVRAMIRFNGDWDRPGALADLDRAVTINPSFARAFQYRSSVLTTMARFDEAVASASKASALDPLSVTERTTLGIRLYYAGRYPDAIAQLERTVDQSPTFPVAFWGLGEAFREQGRNDAAIESLRQAVRTSGESIYMRAWLAHALAVAGQTGEAQRIRQDIERQAASRYVSPFLFALMASGGGDRAETLAWLAKTRLARSGWVPFLQVEPQFRWLRGDPAFAAVAEVGEGTGLGVSLDRKAQGQIR